MERVEINNLITKIGMGDEQALEKLYNGISKAVFSFVLTYVKDRGHAEDLLQETFITLMSKPKGFTDADNGMAYILTIARNMSLNFIKREKRSVSSSAEEIEVFAGSFEGKSEKSAILKDFMQTLSEEEKRVLILKEVYGFTFEEIRKTMKLSLATVKRRMESVKEKFKIYDTI